MVKVVIKHDLKLTPKELAREFWDMSSLHQAQFFNELSEICGVTSATLNMQMQFLVNEKVLTDKGRQVMRTIGEYGGIENGGF